MAKLSSDIDFSPDSPLVNLFAVPTTKRQREWGPLEYDTALSTSDSGAKLLMMFDLASYSPLINLAGSNPTTQDMSGATILGAQREWGPLEYNSSISYAVSPKAVTWWDLAGESPLVNYEKPTNSPFCPTTQDMAGTTVQLNARTAHDITRYFPTLQDSRGTEALGGFREFGTVEFDDSLRADDSVPTAGENAQAVWDALVASANEDGSFGLYIQDNIVPASAVADAVWDEATSGHTTTGTFGKLMSKLLTVAKFIGLK